MADEDDYYCKEAFRKIHDRLIPSHADNAIAMVRFILKNTLSDSESEIRGVCKGANGHSRTIGVVEISNIAKTVIGAEADGVELDVNIYVSMNFLGTQVKRAVFLCIWLCWRGNFLNFWSNLYHQIR